MFEPGQLKHWWPYSQKFDELMYRRANGVRKCVLKCVGYAHVMKLIEERQPKRVLEIGHGPTSPIFDYLQEQDVEIWGIDRFSNTETTTQSHYTEFRARYPNARFINAFFGTEEYDIPSDYFDLVCSVSVIEHVAIPDVGKVFGEIARVLRPGGLSAHSADVFLGDREFKYQNIRAIYAAHQETGLKWLNPVEKFAIEIDPVNVMFEDARGVMEVYLSHLPPEKRRWPGNYITMLLGAEKPR